MNNEKNQQMDTNRKIYASLVKRDSKEKQVVLGKLIEANDTLMTLVNTVKNDLDEKNNLLEKSQTQNKQLHRRIVELETLLKMKDDIIKRMTESNLWLATIDSLSWKKQTELFDYK